MEYKEIKCKECGNAKKIKLVKFTKEDKSSLQRLDNNIRIYNRMGLYGFLFFPFIGGAILALFVQPKITEFYDWRIALFIILALLTIISTVASIWVNYWEKKRDHLICKRDELLKKYGIGKYPSKDYEII